MKRILTAESVCIGHPDKLCDRISDHILDAALRLDPNSRVAVEALATGNKIVVAGEISCSGRLNAREIVRDALEEAGYDPDMFTISVFLHAQSRDIAEGVKRSLEARTYGKGSVEIGAGDQGTMYGYATDECEEMLPLPLVLSHRICLLLDDARMEGRIKGILSDGKAQVSVEYEDDVPKRVSAVVISVQHMEDKTLGELEEDIFREVVPTAFADFPLDEGTKVYINPSGRFVKGGPEADTGLTGRKIMVDTYGGLAPHGGGAFSGKDATKVDRSGAYMARFIARNIVSAGLAKRCTVALSYAIGKADPVAVDVCTHGTGVFPDERLSEAVPDVFELRPGEIIRRLGLTKPIFSGTSAYGHFTDPDFPWEQDDKDSQKRLKERLDDV